MEFATRKLNRLKNFNYSEKGIYFVTVDIISTSQWLSRIEGGILHLLPFGEIIKKTWEDTPNHYQSCLLDEYIIMPDHFQAIIIFEETNSLHNKSLSKIIQAFKSLSKKRIKVISQGIPFVWHKSFHDHIIRSDEELHKIRHYIKTNPLRWKRKKKDKS
jgi:putative transposase